MYSGDMPHGMHPQQAAGMLQGSTRRGHHDSWPVLITAAVLTVMMMAACALTFMKRRAAKRHVYVCFSRRHFGSKCENGGD